MSAPRVVVFGAGAIGCYLGVRLSAAGAPVTLIGRRPLLADRGAIGAVDLDGKRYAPGPDLILSDDPAAASDAELCLVTVKSQDTEAAARALSPVLPAGAPVISFQNGLGNATRLREGGLHQPIAGGMVTFNVLRTAPADFRQATSGPLIAGPLPDEAGRVLARLVETFARAGLPLGIRRDIEAVQASKLLLNLNNGIVALAGLPIATALRSRPIRLCLSDCIREGLRVFEAAGQRVASVGLLSPALVAHVLRLPDVLFHLAARPMLRVDPAARSSTHQDLDRGKLTEIDHLNGVVVAIGERAGVDAPLNRRIVAGIHALERAPRPLRFLTEAELTGLRATSAA